MISQKFILLLFISQVFEKIFAFNNYEKWKLLSLQLETGDPSFVSEILHELETWKHTRIIEVTRDEIKIGIGPHFTKYKLQKLKKRFNLKASLLYHDISKLIQNERRKAKRSVTEDHFDRYMDYEKMEEFFSVLESSYPETVQRKIVGKSYEGRNISLFIISSKESRSVCQNTKLPDAASHLNNEINGNFENKSVDQSNHHSDLNDKVRQRRQTTLDTRPGNATHNFIYLNQELLKAMNLSLKNTMKEKYTTEKPVIFIDAGLHSREWICPAVALYLIKRLAENPSLISQIDWFIMPLINPDGYKFSWNGDRFWRKTRSISGTSGCYGADMNRNFDFHWGEVDTSKNSCAENYGGFGPNSEIETVLIRNLLLKEKHRLKAYFSLHNWGQQILYPYSYSTEKFPHTEEELDRMGKGMVHAIKKSQNVDYQTGRGSVLLYPASGTSTDWAYDVLGVPYSYLVELRDSLGLLGFLLPESLIKPTGEDMFSAVKFLANEILIKQNNSCL